MFRETFTLDAMPVLREKYRVGGAWYTGEKRKGRKKKRKKKGRKTKEGERGVKE